MLFCFFCASMGLSAQEAEPNDSCLQAQPMGTPELPFALHGSLDALSEGFDIDFFRFVLEAGTEVVVRLEGESTGQGTLFNPLAAMLDSSCNAILFDFSSGLNQSARLRFAVPADGEFTIAATANFDFALQGNGAGSYRLQLDRFRAVGSVTARLVDARTGQPLPGNGAVFSNASLLRCNEDGICSAVDFTFPDPEGVLFFPSSLEPLEAGCHFVFARAFGYEDRQTPLFELGEGQHLDLGDIRLTPFAVIGSRTGRVVDALDGFPLSGDSPHFSGRGGAGLCLHPFVQMRRIRLLQPFPRLSRQPGPVPLQRHRLLPLLQPDASLQNAEDCQFIVISDSPAADSSKRGEEEGTRCESSRIGAAREKDFRCQEFCWSMMRT